MLSLARAVAERSPAQRPASTLLFRQMTLSGVLERYYRKAQAHPALRLARGEALDIAADAEGVRLRFPAGGAGRTRRRGGTEGGPACAAGMHGRPPGDEGMLPVTAGSRAAILPDCSRFDGYAASSFICFPYETRRTGIVGRRLRPRTAVPGKLCGRRAGRCAGPPAGHAGRRARPLAAPPQR